MGESRDMENFIDVLHAIKWERNFGASGPEAQAKIDALIANLVAGQRNMTKGMPTVYAEIARRIIEAEANWDQKTGKSYCGQMAPPG